MSNLKLHIECGDTEGITNLLKLLVRNTDCEDWVDCENTQDSWQSILKRLIVETDEGLALSVCGCSGGTGLLPTTDLGLVSSYPPSEAEISAVIGTPAELGEGYHQLIKYYYVDESEIHIHNVLFVMDGKFWITTMVEIL